MIYDGNRDRTLDTRHGSLQPPIPKLRQSSYFPPSRRVPHRNVSGRTSKQVCNVYCAVPLAQSAIKRLVGA